MIFFNIVRANAHTDSDSTELDVSIEVSFKVEHKELVKFGELIADAEYKHNLKDFKALISKRIK